MTREADEKLGKVFSFDTEKPGDSAAAETGQRDETFTIPAFLRRGAKTKTPEPVPLWEDEDFARIAATAEQPKPADKPTTAPSDTPDPLKEKESPKEPDVQMAAPTVAEVSLFETEPDAAQIPEKEESATPSRFEKRDLSATAMNEIPATPSVEDRSIEPHIPVAETVTEPSSPASQTRVENAEIHIPPILSTTTSVEATEERAEPVLFSRSQIRIEPRENIEQGFERREPRLGPVKPGGEMPARARASWRGENFRTDAPTEEGDHGRWRLGPALDARDIDTFETPIIEDAEWEREEKASPIRWVVLAFAVAAGGYAVAHQLDTGGSLTASLPFVKAQEQVADFAPSITPSTAPATPAPAAQMPSASKPETTSRFVPSAKIAHAAPPAQPAAIPKPAPQEKVARAEDTVRAASEAPHETATPVTLAPGPRSLSAQPAVQTRGDAVATGELVLDVQQRLTRLGYANVPLNGRLDADTRAAIMSFQRNSGLGMTGLIDSTFLENLRHTSPVGMRLVKGPDAITPR